MNAYSEDLRKKIVEALGRGMGKSEAARTFSVSLSSINRYAKLAEEGGSLAPKKRPGSAPKLDEKAMRSSWRKTSPAPLREPSATLRVHTSHDGSHGKSLDDVPRHSQDRTHQEKGGRSATERDEFLSS